MMTAPQGKMSSTTKKVLITIFAVVIVLFVVIGLISEAVKKLMKKQGLKADEMLANVTKVDYFKKESSYIKFGIKKNIRLFYQEARIPFLIILGCILTYILYCLFANQWGYNPFDRVNGFGSLLIRLEWPKQRFFGINLVSDWPTIIKPIPTKYAIFSYFFVPITFFGCGWFLYYTQCYIARSLRIRKIARSIYRKKLVPDEKPTLLAPEQ